MRKASALVFVIALAPGLVSCGVDEGSDGADRGSTTTGSSASTTTSNDSTTTSSTGSSTTGGSSTTDTTAPAEPDDDDGTGEGPVPDDKLPGERIEIYPYEGASLAVVAVAADDVLNVRHGPGVRFGVATELGPLDEGVTATGHNRTIDDGTFWSQVEVDGTTGWVNTSFVAQPGQTTDITSELPGDLGGRTMVDLGTAVAEARTPGEDDPEPRITVTAAPETGGDLAEITVDVTGYADDAVKGERLHVFATPDPSGEGFRLRTVEATTLCARGVDAGLCV